MRSSDTNHSLVIVGGADKAFQKDIYRAVIQKATDFAGGAPRIGVIAAATAQPKAGFEKIKNRLEEAGAAEVVYLPLSASDQELFQNANNPHIADLVLGFHGIWFTGGDQNLIIRCLKNNDGSDSVVLKTLRQQHRHGMVLAGTSAGAAIMSDPMIQGGSCITSLSGQDCLQTGQGLGFFSGGLVDQHFDVRGRLLRLCVAMEQERVLRGFGVCENSAMIVDGTRVTVAGACGVFVIHRADQSMPYSFELSYLEKGDRYNLHSAECKFPDKKTTWQDERERSMKPVASGVLSAYGDLRSFISTEILDNHFSRLWQTDNEEVRFGKSFILTPSVEDTAEDSLLGYELRFYRNAGKSRGYYNDAGSVGFSCVGFSFHPISVKVTFSNHNAVHQLHDTLHNRITGDI